MTEHDDGGPAFPHMSMPLRAKEGFTGVVASSWEASQVVTRGGMSLRDYFATAALQGIVAYTGSEGLERGPGDLAERVYELADAMLKARESGQ